MHLEDLDIDIPYRTTNATKSFGLESVVHSTV